MPEHSDYLNMSIECKRSLAYTVLTDQASVEKDQNQPTIHPLQLWRN
jgi:hypothetical protein